MSDALCFIYSMNCHPKKRKRRKRREERREERKEGRVKKGKKKKKEKRLRDLMEQDIFMSASDQLTEWMNILATPQNAQHA
ncbi:hypothetical protein RclHR1_20210003 [Rhizophagus clarus]|uniref:Uncharacterized protein n=1 Tax=Rhizophagus clarus TaxID=94130 RepID=A0A2Z6R6E9_9GLOM|nr:hypothetical protein RclHR1_20210003 [Rhizophagus clarus]